MTLETLQNQTFARFASPSLAAIQKRSVFALALLTLSACGGGSGDSTQVSEQNTLIIGGGASTDVSGVSDVQLRRNAATRAGAGLGANLENLSRLSDEASSNQSEDGVFAGIDTSGTTQSIDSLDNDTDNFLNNSLGIDDPGAIVTRDGNIMTIDPDDQRICGDDIPLAGGLNNDQTQCQQLASDLTVQVDARSEESGIITYLFQNAPVLLIGYSPMGASYEINLAGLQRVTQRAEQLNGDASTAQMLNMSGAIRFSGTILNDEPGQEAGELSLNVTEAINIGGAGNEEGLSLQPSTVFKVSLDEATGDVSMGVNWGALQLVTSSSSADSNGNFSSSTSAISLGGLSAELSFNEDQPALKVTNIGIGDVPLTVTINSIESVNLTLAKFGITIDSETGTVNLDGPLNASVMLNNIAQLLDDQAPEFTASATVSAPANTVLNPQVNGSTLLSSGGPLSATLIGGDGVSSGQTEISINAGECFGSSGASDDANLATDLISTVPCN